VEQRGLKRFQARTYLWFGSFVMPWTKHVQACRDLLRRAFEAANKIGDLTIAAYSCHDLSTSLLAAGDPLPEVQREAACRSGTDEFPGNQLNRGIQKPPSEA
jgi:hypothetical protein